MRPILIPPPTRMTSKGPRTKWDDLALVEPTRKLHLASAPTPMRGLSDDLPLAGTPKFVKRFK